MKVIGIDISQDGMHATVTLRPNWLARLFGAQRLVVELMKVPDKYDDEAVWRSAVTHRKLGWLAFGSMIQCALEAQPLRPVGKLPAVYVVHLTKDTK